MKTEKKMTTHTPGPWKIDSLGDSIYWTDSHGEHMVVVYELGSNEADAKLITAAPDLLQALVGLYEDQIDYIRINNLSGAENNHWMVIARAAIAKATEL